MKNEIPQFSLNINKIFNKKFENKNSNLNSTTVQPKFNAQSEFGNEILIIDDINNKANEAQKVFDIYPFFNGSTKKHYVYLFYRKIDYSMEIKIIL